MSRYRCPYQSSDEDEPRGAEEPTHARNPAQRPQRPGPPIRPRGNSNPLLENSNLWGHEHFVNSVFSMSQPLPPRPQPHLVPFISPGQRRGSLHEIVPGTESTSYSMPETSEIYETQNDIGLHSNNSSNDSPEDEDELCPYCRGIQTYGPFVPDDEPTENHREPENHGDSEGNLCPIHGCPVPSWWVATWESRDHDQYGYEWVWTPDGSQLRTVCLTPSEPYIDGDDEDTENPRWDYYADDPSDSSDPEAQNCDVEDDSDEDNVRACQHHAVLNARPVHLNWRRNMAEYTVQAPLRREHTRSRRFAPGHPIRFEYSFEQAPEEEVLTFYFRRRL